MPFPGAVEAKAARLILWRLRRCENLQSLLPAGWLHLPSGTTRQPNAYKPQQQHGRSLQMEATMCARGRTACSGPSLALSPLPLSRLLEARPLLGLLVYQPAPTAPTRATTFQRSPSSWRCLSLPAYKYIYRAKPTSSTINPNPSLSNDKERFLPRDDHRGRRPTGLNWGERENAKFKNRAGWSRRSATWERRAVSSLHRRSKRTAVGMGGGGRAGGRVGARPLRPGCVFVVSCAAQQNAHCRGPSTKERGSEGEREATVDKRV